MPLYVSRDEISAVVVSNWIRLMEETARERGHDVSTVQPFPPLQQTYADVLQEIRDRTQEGLEHYRRMVQALPWYAFREDPEMKSDELALVPSSDS